MRRHGSMMVVLSGLLAASLAIGLPVGSAYADEPTDGTGAGTSATEVLDSLEVKGRAPKTGYKRTQFGKAWADVDHNGCDTRNDILNRDLTGVRHKWRTHNCVVKSGKLHDPYTGKDIKFKKGKKTSTAVQIDHVVALSDAWQKGAQKLSEERRTALANDPYNLLAVQGRANQKKSDGDAATWLPSNKGFRCEYMLFRGRAVLFLQHFSENAEGQRRLKGGSGFGYHVYVEVHITEPGNSVAQCVGRKAVADEEYLRIILRGYGAQKLYSAACAEIRAAYADDHECL